MVVSSDRLIRITISPQDAKNFYIKNPNQSLNSYVKILFLQDLNGTPTTTKTTKKTTKSDDLLNNLKIEKLRHDINLTRLKLWREMAATELPFKFRLNVLAGRDSIPEPIMNFGTTPQAVPIVDDVPISTCLPRAVQKIRVVTKPLVNGSSTLPATYELCDDCGHEHYVNAMPYFCSVALCSCQKNQWLCKKCNHEHDSKDSDYRCTKCSCKGTNPLEEYK